MKPIYDPKKIKMTKDSDKDGIFDIIDCAPHDPNKDGFITKLLNKMKTGEYKETPERQFEIDIEKGYRAREKELQKKTEQEARFEAIRQSKKDIAKIEKAKIMKKYPTGTVGQRAVQRTDKVLGGVQTFARTVPQVHDKPYLFSQPITKPITKPKKIQPKISRQQRNVDRLGQLGYFGGNTKKWQ